MGIFVAVAAYRQTVTGMCLGDHDQGLRIEGEVTAAGPAAMIFEIDGLSAAAV
jgi:hypothetical protein